MMISLFLTYALDRKYHVSTNFHIRHYVDSVSADTEVIWKQLSSVFWDK